MTELWLQYADRNVFTWHCNTFMTGYFAYRRRGIRLEMIFALLVHILTLGRQLL